MNPTGTPSTPSAASTQPPREASVTSRRSRALAVGAALALIALGLAWELVLAPTGARSLALKVVPLALVMPGLLKFRLRTYRWTSLLVWLYVAEGAMRWASDRGLSSSLAGIELVLSLVLFGACVMHVRHRLKHGPSLAAKPS